MDSKLHSSPLRPLGRAGTVLVLATLGWFLPGPVGGQQAAPGRIAGAVVGADNGRPLQSAQIQVVEANTGSLSDPTGRYRTPPLPPGTYTVRISLIGYATTSFEGVVVESGQVLTLNAALESAAVELGEIVVEATRTTQTSSEAGLLALQRAAPVVTDGISAEQISRSPDSDAGDALARVTGVSVVDEKFVVVRGLAERYSNTMLNGTELASPEPGKRVVPMDVFPASLLESVVTTKAATPDRPADFAGGSVEIRTKEFPNQRILEFSMSGGWDDRTTFKQRPIFGLSGADYLGFDGKNRFPGAPEATEAYAERLRNEWIPSSRYILPDLGFGVTYGDQLGEFERAIGYVISVDYGRSTDFTPDRFWAYVDDFDRGGALLQATNTSASAGADWGVVANLSMRRGANHTYGWKNLVTREIEEFTNTRLGIDPELQGPGTGDQILSHQVRFVERSMAQTQLTGTHVLPAVLGSTLDWKATVAWAGRDEPENRTVNYLFSTVDNWFQIDDSAENSFWYRFLDEWSYSAQLDWSVPLSLLNQDDVQVRWGGRARYRDRDFNAERWDMNRPLGLVDAPDGEAVYALPPEQLFTPENIGRSVGWRAVNVGGLPYMAEEFVYAAYLMTDLAPFDWLRFVGGLRAEQWTLDVTSPGVPDQNRDALDLLWSANATVRVGENTNVRLAGYQTLSRPDPRELSQTIYVPVAGQCSSAGNPNLDRARIANLDVRWEWFPAAGEVLSIGAFYKKFTDPFVQVVSSVSLGCRDLPVNAASADNYGIEAEVRRNLGFLSGALADLSAGLNVTFVEGSIVPKPENNLGTVELPLQDQSNFLFNGSLSYAPEGGSFSGSLLFNHFGERVRRYGQSLDLGGVFVRPPDVIELPRSTVDVKFSQRLGERLSVSFSARNLTNESIEWVQPTAEAGRVPVSLEPLGVSGSLGVSYSVR